MASFVGQATGVDGNRKGKGRKRHVICDPLGLSGRWWCMRLISADGAKAQRVVAPLQGYLHRMEKILTEAAYKKVFLC